MTRITKLILWTCIFIALSVEAGGGSVDITLEDPFLRNVKREEVWRGDAELPVVKITLNKKVVFNGKLKRHGSLLTHIYFGHVQADVSGGKKEATLEVQIPDQSFDRVMDFSPSRGRFLRISFDSNTGNLKLEQSKRKPSYK